MADTVVYSVIEGYYQGDLSISNSGTFSTYENAFKRFKLIVGHMIKNIGINGTVDENLAKIQKEKRMLHKDKDEGYCYLSYETTIWDESGEPIEAADLIELDESLYTRSIQKVFKLTDGTVEDQIVLTSSNLDQEYPE